MTWRVRISKFYRKFSCESGLSNMLGWAWFQLCFIHEHSEAYFAHNLVCLAHQCPATPLWVQTRWASLCSCQYQTAGTHQKVVAFAKVKNIAFTISTLQHSVMTYGAFLGFEMLPVSKKIYFIQLLVKLYHYMIQLCKLQPMPNLRQARLGIDRCPIPNTYYNYMQTSPDPLFF